MLESGVTGTEGVAHSVTLTTIVEEAALPTPRTIWIIEFTLQDFGSYNSFLANSSSGKFFRVFTLGSITLSYILRS